MFAPGTLAVTQGITAFNAFLPPLAQVRKNHPMHNPDFAADVRAGEMAGTVITVGIGVIASGIVGHPLPVYTAVLICAVIIAVYEYVLRSNSAFEYVVPAVAKEPEGERRYA
jgi:hypothetical protein